MKILDHINNIDNMIEEKKSEENKAALFGQTVGLDGGLGFTTTTYTTVDMGNMHNIYSPNGNYSVVQDGVFTHVTEF